MHWARLTLMWLVALLVGGAPADTRLRLQDMRRRVGAMLLLSAARRVSRFGDDVSLLPAAHAHLRLGSRGSALRTVFGVRTRQALRGSGRDAVAAMCALLEVLRDPERLIRRMAARLARGMTRWVRLLTRAAPAALVLSAPRRAPAAANTS